MCRHRPIPFGSLVKMARKAESAHQFGELLRQRYARNVRGTTLVTTIIMRMRCSTRICRRVRRRPRGRPYDEPAARRAVALDRLAPPAVGPAPLEAGHCHRRSPGGVAGRDGVRVKGVVGPEGTV